MRYDLGGVKEGKWCSSFIVFTNLFAKRTTNAGSEKSSSMLVIIAYSTIPFLTSHEQHLSGTFGTYSSFKALLNRIFVRL